MKEYNIKLTEKELNFMLAVLGDQPYNKVSQLISNLLEQATLQVEKEKTNK